MDLEIAGARSREVMFFFCFFFCLPCVTLASAPWIPVWPGGATPMIYLARLCPDCDGIMAYHCRR